MSSLHVVLGGGPAGTTLATRLADLGELVRLVDRLKVATDGQIESVPADLSDPHAATRASEGAAVIYHCVNVNVPYQLQVDLMPGIGEADTDGGVKPRCTPCRARHAVSLWRRPTASTSPRTQSGRRRRGRDSCGCKLEERYRAAHERGEVSVALGRSADFFGPRVLNSTLGTRSFRAPCNDDRRRSVTSTCHTATATFPT